MARAIALLALSGVATLTSCATPPSRAAGAVLMPDTGVTLPTTRAYDFFFVRVRLNDRGPFYLLLDTGTDYLTIDTAVYDELGGGGQPPVERMLGANGELIQVHGGLTVSTLTAGDLTLREVPTLAMELDALQNALGIPVHGLLGVGPFSGLTVVLDYPRSRVRVTSERLGPVDGERVFDIGTGTVPEVPVRIGAVRISCLVDSGCGWPVALPDSYREELIEERGSRPLQSVSIAGTHTRTEGRLRHSVLVGPFNLRGMRAIAGPGRPKLGAPLLRNFEVHLDLAGRRVELRRP